MAASVDRCHHLGAMPEGIVKEVEYVLEPAPYFWLVGPGTVDPAAHVWQVQVDNLNASFKRIPQPPATAGLI